MDRVTATVMGTAAALAAGPGLAQAGAVAPPAPPVAASYAELLQPIPNAVERLKAANAADAVQPRLIQAQYSDRRDHHHHHHHHHDRRWYQQRGYYFFGGQWVLRPPRDPHHHHHHHHHHHNNY